MANELSLRAKQVFFIGESMLKTAKFEIVMNITQSFITIWIEDVVASMLEYGFVLGAMQIDDGLCLGQFNIFEKT